MAEATVTLSKWRDPEHNRWSFRNISQIVPCAMVWPSVTASRPFPTDLQDIPLLSYEWQGQTQTLAQMLQLSRTDGFIVLHKGQLIHESYDGGLKPHTPHILFSITKSVVSLVTAILIDQGELTPTQTIGARLPELKQSGYGDATIADLLNMTVGIGFVEDYLAPTGDMVRYREASGWNPGDPRDAIGLHRFLATLPSANPH